MTDAEFESQAKRADKGNVWRDYRRKIIELKTRGWPTQTATLEAKRLGVERLAELEYAKVVAQQLADDGQGLEIPPDEESPISQKTKSAFLDDVHWVYENIGKPMEQRDTPPSHGARWLMIQAEADPKVLREPLMMMAKRADLDKTEAAIREDCRRSYQEIRKVLDRIGGRT